MTSPRPLVMRAPLLVSLLVVSATVVVLKLLGRVWWCECATPTLFVSDPATRHNSQHVFDWYSFSHVLHGVIFFWLLWPLRRRLSLAWRVAIAVLVEAVWEVLENTPAVIDRYRTATAALGYEGDSVVNSVGDILFCAAGFFLAGGIGWRWSITLFVVLEFTMLAFIRDNLALNVLMLLYPLEGVRAWQEARLSG